MRGYRFSTNIACGIQHEKMGLPCQDAVSCIETEHAWILADADGHSDRRCFRAERGSEFACKAVEIVLGSYNGQEEWLKREIIASPDLILGQIERAVIYQWDKLTSEDWEAHPITDDEWEIIQNHNDQKWRDLMKWDPEGFRRKVYGTNLVFGMVMENFWFASQNGDGTCVCVFPNGVYEKPIPEDPEGNFANFSTSLCDRYASETFRHSFSCDHLAAMFLCSDGIGDNTRPEDLNDMIYRVGYCTLHQSPEMETAIKENINGKWRNCDDVSFCAVFDESLLGFVEPQPTKDDVMTRKKLLEDADQCIEQELECAEKNLTELKEQIQKTEALIKERRKELEEMEKQLKGWTELKEVWEDHRDDLLERRECCAEAKSKWQIWKEKIFRFWDDWEAR